MFYIIWQPTATAYSLLVILQKDGLYMRFHYSFCINLLLFYEKKVMVSQPIKLVKIYPLPKLIKEKWVLKQNLIKRSLRNLTN